MACFFHSFARAADDEATKDTDGRIHLSASEEDDEAETVLESILKYGLLCTPEWLHIHPARDTDDPRKQALIAKNKPEHSHSQSRFCVTLCEPEDLYRPTVRGLSQASAPSKSHVDLFGCWTIGFDPLVSRRLGFLPTSYFAPTDMFGGRNEAGGVPGLNLQMIQRLKELRELLILIAYLEQGLEFQGCKFRPASELADLQLNLAYEGKALAKIRDLSPAARLGIVELLNIDRLPAFYLIDFLEMMFGLFQETDSSKDGTPYAFYQQREWRLIHHMRIGMRWYCLGRQPPFRDPLGPERLPQAEVLRAHLLKRPRRDPRSYFRSCWVLEEVDGKRPCDYLSDIIVPRRAVSRVREMASEYRLGASVSAAEDYGFGGH